MDGIESRLHNIEEGIGLLPTVGSIKREPTKHVHSSDIGHPSVLQRLKKRPAVSPKGTGPLIPTALVVGSGAILSCLPHLPVDLIILADQNPLVLEWILKTREAIQASTNRRDYKRRVYSNANPMHAELLASGVKIEKGLEDEQLDLGPDHFLYSSRAFAKARAAVSQVPMVPIAVDLTSVEVVRRLSEVLMSNGAGVTFANFTNMFEWAKGRDTAGEKATDSLAESLTTLPWGVDPVIAFSSRRDHQDPPRLKVANSVGDYLADASRDADRLVDSIRETQRESARRSFEIFEIF